jgi:predicted nucleotidyltransferase
MINIGVDKENIIKLCQQHQITLLMLFGSYATGKCRQNSDIDIAVLIGDVNRPHKVNKQQVNDTLESLYTALLPLLSNKKLDLVSLNYAGPLLWYEVSRNGEVLYEQDAEIYRDFCLRALQRHNDAYRFYQAEKEYLKRFIKGD